MRLKGRLDRLERTYPQAQVSVGAKEELCRRFERADSETRDRLLRAISERKT